MRIWMMVILLSVVAIGCSGGGTIPGPTSLGGDVVSIEASAALPNPTASIIALRSAPMPVRYSISDASNISNDVVGNQAATPTPAPITYTINVTQYFYVDANRHSTPTERVSSKGYNVLDTMAKVVIPCSDHRFCHSDRDPEQASRRVRAS
jgi:hypothetical protein